VTVLRSIALLLAMILAVLSLAWPVGWPKSPGGRSLVSYTLAFVFAIAALLLFPYGHGPSVPFFGMVALLAWGGLALLWFIRRNPQISNPEWTRQPWSVADWGLIVILLAASLAAALN
jgi:hypothetical protein